MDNFIDVEFFQKQCSILVKHFYILYSLCGAIIFENYTRFKFKCFLIVYFCVAYLCCIVPQLEVIIRDATILDTFLAAGYLIHVQFAVLSFYILHQKRKEFLRLFNLINDHSNKPTLIPDLPDDDEALLKDTGVLRACFKIYQYIIRILVTSYITRFPRMLEMDSDTPIQINQQREFSIPFFCNVCNTPVYYILAYHVSFVSSTLFVLFIYVVLCLVPILSMYLKNQAIALQNDIRYNSKLAFEKFETYDRLEEEELEKKPVNDFALRDLNGQRNRQVQEYMVKVQQWIKSHQSLVGCINQYRSSVQKLMEVQLANSLIVTSLCVNYFVTVFVNSGEEVFTYFCYAIFTILMIIIRCKLGDVLNDISEMLSDAVYSTPWFYLPAKEQKVILNFMTLSQRTQKLRVFGASFLTSELVPKILNNVYGYVQVLRLVLKKNGI